MAETPTTATEIRTATAPLLTRQSTHELLYGGGARALTIFTVFLGLFAGRRGASLIVRESVAEELENWRDDWGYSLPVVVIDTMWNLAFVVVSMVMLFSAAREQPNVPVRVWICVYALQCVVHVVLVWLEYRRRRRSRRSDTTGSSSSDSDRSNYSTGSDEMSAGKRWETFNTIIQYLWWLFALVWLLPKFEVHTAPHLFWLTLTFMAVDVFFAALGFLKWLVMVLAVSFCFPLIMAFLNFMGCQGGASEADIRVLPKYRFVVSSDVEPLDIGGRMVPFETNGPDFSPEHALHSEDADCCICLCPYEDGAQLHLLPCNHHYHAACILKWLKICRTCPLCKYIIVQDAQV